MFIHQDFKIVVLKREKGDINDLSKGPGDIYVWFFN